MPCVSVVVSGDFCRFKLALPSLLSMSKVTWITVMVTNLTSSGMLIYHFMARKNWNVEFYGQIFIFIHSRFLVEEITGF